MHAAFISTPFKHVCVVVLIRVFLGSARPKVRTRYSLLVCIHRLPTHSHTAVCYSNAAVFNSAERHQGVLGDVSVRGKRVRVELQSNICCRQTAYQTTPPRLLFYRPPVALTTITDSCAHTGSESSNSGTYKGSDGQMEECCRDLFQTLICHLTQKIVLYIDS